MQCDACGHENLDGARFCANCGATIPVVNADVENPLVGQVVGGRYRITRVIGEGGMGIVYEGEQRMGSTVRKVAVKTLHAELSRDPSVTARFHRECGTVAQLEHPNTIKVYDFGAMPDGTLYIAMEYLAGDPLDKVIEKDGAMSPSRVLHLLRQISGSLDEAHRQGIVHRDLKPENVILVQRAGEKDVVKLLDFGIAARTESADAEKEAKLTQQGMVLGTPPYMSPEQFTGKALDKRSDIYSLGVMAYEMLTGKLPFDANTPWEWATKHMTAQPRPFETMQVSTQIPGTIRQAILKALAKDRDERFASVPEFIATLEQGAADAPKGMAPVTARESAATAAMEAAPDFGFGGGTSAPTAAMPAQPAMMSPAPAPAVRPAPPPAERSGGLNIGLVAGLGGVAVVLLVGIGYALMGGDKSGSDDTAFTPSPTPVAVTAAATPEETPEPEESEPEIPPQDVAVVTPAQGQQGSTPRPPAGTPRPPTATAAPTAAPPATTPPPAPTAAPTSPPSTTSDACVQCISLVSAGNITGAAAQFRACSDTAKKNACSTRARRSAPQIAKASVQRGDCAGARRTRESAISMNAGSPGLDKSVQDCN